MKYILGLDVSTSNIGLALYDIEKKDLALLTHISPTHDIDVDNEFEDLYLKAALFENYLADKPYINDIYKIIIEEPLIKSRTPNVAAKLNRFAGFIYSALKNINSNFVIDYISVNNARKYAFPEIVKKGRVFGNIPSKIGEIDLKKLNDYKKNVILNLVSQRFPNIKWKVTQHYTLNDSNYDMADAVTVILGYIGMQTKNKEEICDLDRCIDYIMVQNEFKLYAKALREKNLKLKERKKLHKKFLVENIVNEKLLGLDLTK